MELKKLSRCIKDSILSLVMRIPVYGGEVVARWRREERVNNLVRAKYNSCVHTQQIELVLCAESRNLGPYYHDNEKDRRTACCGSGRVKPNLLLSSNIQEICCWKGFSVEIPLTSYIRN